jgi:hypothetical protein
MMIIMKNIKILCLLFLAILIFQSPGTSIIQYNLAFKHSFTDGFMYFLRPTFIIQVWLNCLYPLYFISYVIMMFLFIRKVKVNSWQFIFCAIVCLVFSVIGNLYSMNRFHDLLIPIVLLTIFKKHENNNISVRF